MPEPDPIPTRRRRLRFLLSLRVLMVVVLILGGWLGWIVHRARVLREVVAAVERSGGFVILDTDLGASPPAKRPPPWAPRWVVDRLGAEYFYTVDYAGIGETGTDEVAGQVARLGRIYSVHFNGTGLTDAGLARLRGLDFQILGLRRTKVTDAGLAHLEGISQLEALDLAKTSVGDAGMAHVGRLPGIKYLVLEETRVTDLGLDRLGPLKDLIYLDLEHTAVGDRGVARLASLTGLDELNLYWTQVTPPAVLALRAALPRTYVAGFPAPGLRDKRGPSR